MTNLIITVDDSKKRLKFTGDKIALGERVAVEVVGIDVNANTRLRVLVGDTTIAIGGVWNGANCELNLFTVQAEKVHCGYGRVVLDDPEANKLYGIGELELLPWPKECGADVPYDLGNYPDVIEDFRNEINEKFTEQDSEIESALRNIEDDNETFKNEQLERQNTFEETVNANVANKADVAALESEAIARENADDELSKRIKLNNENNIKNTVYISNVESDLKTEVSDRKSAVEAEKQSRLVAEGGIRESISAEIARAKAAEAKVESKISTIVADDVNKSARTIAAEEVAKVVANAPQDLDTLKEIADYIESDKTGAAEMVTQIDANAKAISAEQKRAQGAEAALGEAIAKKVDAVEGKGLSTEDYTTNEKNKLEEIEAGAQKNPDLSGYAKKDELSKIIDDINDLLDDKADADEVWLRGNDVTGDTNFAQSIKVNEISVLDDETPGSFITLNGNVNLPTGGIYCPENPITASSFDSYMYYVQSGGALVFNGYDEFLFPFEVTLDANAVEQLSSNSWYVQENLRGHITHDILYNEWDGGTYGTVTITPIDEFGEYSDFYLRSNGSLSMSGSLSCDGVNAEWISCTWSVSCSDVFAAGEVSACSRTDEWGGEYGGVIVRDELSPDTVASLLGGMLRIGDKNYSDCVEVTVATGDLSLIFYHQDEKLTFSFSDLATLRTMIDDYPAVKQMVNALNKTTIDHFEGINVSDMTQEQKSEILDFFLTEYFNAKKLLKKD